ncbi:MAG: hypothetical protein E6J90_01730 [Deltaproteobacteria bacterium]|nr:MAG: hypothetical protein E6J91_25505 [Deltaproteobacteria bacterium]TMQ27763.1 MAG: hypothetical protein E6J90_01730 [Deltaproteobacteria bacterium]
MYRPILLVRRSQMLEIRLLSGSRRRTAPSTAGQRDLGQPLLDRLTRAPADTLTSTNPSADKPEPWPVECTQTARRVAPVTSAHALSGGGESVIAEPSGFGAVTSRSVGLNAQRAEAGSDGDPDDDA